MGVLVRMKGAFRIPFHTKGRHRTQVPAPQESNGGNTEGQALGGVEFFYGSGENMCGFFSEDGPEMCVCVGGGLVEKQGGPEGQGRVAQSQFFARTSSTPSAFGLEHSYLA